MSKAHDNLVAARALIADPLRWTQASYARNAHGDQAAIGSDEACQWCGLGAIYRQSDRFSDGGRDHWVPGLEELTAAGIAESKDPYFQRIDVINDTHGHAAVMRVYDRAIEATA